MTLPQTDEERVQLLRECEDAVEIIKTSPLRIMSATLASRVLPALYEMYMAHWDAELWMTTCTGCAGLLDRSHADYERAEKAEAALAAADVLAGASEPITCIGQPRRMGMDHNLRPGFVVTGEEVQAVSDALAAYRAVRQGRDVQDG